MAQKARCLTSIEAFACTLKVGTIRLIPNTTVSTSCCSGADDDDATTAVSSPRACVLVLPSLLVGGGASENSSRGGASPTTLPRSYWRLSSRMDLWKSLSSETSIVRCRPSPTICTPRGTTIVSEVRNTPRGTSTGTLAAAAASTAR